MTKTLDHLQLLVVPDHHKLLETKLEGNQGLGLHTLTGLVHHTDGDLPGGLCRPYAGYSYKQNLNIKYSQELIENRKLP